MTSVILCDIHFVGNYYEVYYAFPVYTFGDKFIYSVLFFIHFVLIRSRFIVCCFLVSFVFYSIIPYSRLIHLISLVSQITYFGECLLYYTHSVHRLAIIYILCY